MVTLLSPGPSLPRDRARLIYALVLVASLLLVSPYPQHFENNGVTYLQGVSNGATSTSVLRVPFRSPNTAGSLIVVAARASAHNRTWTVRDLRGNSYILAKQFHTTPAGDEAADLRLYYAYNSVGAANTVSIAVSGAATRLGATVREYGGFFATNPLDRTSAAEGTGTAVSSGTVTTTFADQLLVGLSTNSNNGTYAAGPGFGNLVQHLVGGVASQDRILTRAGTYSSTMTVNPSLGWASIIVTFKTPASGPGHDTTPLGISVVQTSRNGATNVD
jgi:hypothetical protein